MAVTEEPTNIVLVRLDEMRAEMRDLRERVDTAIILLRGHIKLTEGDVSRLMLRVDRLERRVDELSGTS